MASSPLRRVLVTGGAGFIGSELVDALLARPEVERLVVLDALTYAADLQRLAQAQRDPRFHLVEGNVCDLALGTTLHHEESFSAVFHLAAESHVDRSIIDSAPFVTTNVLGSSTQLDLARASDIPLVLCSTDEVYGPTPYNQTFSESAPLRPSSPYSASKASADFLALAHFCTHRQDVRLVRPTNNFGVRQHREKLIPNLIWHALHNRPLPLYGSGQQIRDWIHVADTVAGLIATLEHGRPGTIYHLGAQAERTNLGIARLILRTLGKPHDLIAHVADRPGHDQRYALDTTLTRTRLPWRPRHTLREHLPHVIRELASRLRT